LGYTGPLVSDRERNVVAYEQFEMYDLDAGENKSVEVEFGTFPVRLEKRMHSYMGKYSASADLTTFGGDLATGSIGDLFLSNVVKGIKIEGKELKWNKDRSLWDALPNLVEEDGDESIADRLLKLGIKHNPRIGRHRKFSMVFGEFLPEPGEDEEENGNPTNGSTKSPSTRSSQGELTSQTT
jgi:hypothetical protein